MIGISRASDFVHRSEIVGSKDNQVYQQLKGFIVTAMNEKQNREQGIKYYPRDFVEKVSKCNLPQEYKEAILGGKQL